MTIRQTSRVTYFYRTDPDLGKITAETYCDFTCQDTTCDGHEAPGPGTRCRYCYWKPCNCAELEQSASGIQHTYPIEEI